MSEKRAKKINFIQDDRLWHKKSKKTKLRHKSIIVSTSYSLLKVFWAKVRRRWKAFNGWWDPTNSWRKLPLFFKAIVLQLHPIKFLCAKNIWNCELIFRLIHVILAMKTLLFRFVISMILADYHRDKETPIITKLIFALYKFYLQMVNFCFTNYSKKINQKILFQGHWTYLFSAKNRHLISNWLELTIFITLKLSVPYLQDSMF